MKVEGSCHRHSADCQMLTGSVYRASVRAPKESFSLLTGGPKVYDPSALGWSLNAEEVPQIDRQ